MCQSPIANIDINKEYDESLGTEDVHYQSFARMAEFFGRDMQAHRHDQYFQMHFLDTGQIELQLDDHRYSVQAPLFVLTPPSVPHAFITESDSDGHVLTVREDLAGHLILLRAAAVDDIPAHHHRIRALAQRVKLGDHVGVGGIDVRCRRRCL